MGLVGPQLPLAVGSAAYCSKATTTGDMLVTRRWHGGDTRWHAGINLECWSTHAPQSRLGFECPVPKSGGFYTLSDSTGAILGALVLFQAHWCYSRRTGAILGASVRLNRTTALTNAAPLFQTHLCALKRIPAFISAPLLFETHPCFGAPVLPRTQSCSLYRTCALLVASMLL